MRVVVPYDGRRPKTRLSPVLSADERAGFARAMLDDVLAAVRAAGGDPELLATTPVDVDVPTTVDERPLTAAVNDVLAAADGPLAVVMADLALATGEAVTRLLEAGGDVAVAPGRGGGTNALVVDHPAFRVDYHGVSYRDHREAAARVGADLQTVDSYRLSTDVDDPGDLPEVLLHGEGTAPAWLRDAGLTVTAAEGRVTVTREE